MAELTGRLFRTGLIGTGVKALCCFTPLLAIGLTAAGLGGAILWLDAALIPALIAFGALTVFALVRRRAR